MTTRRSETVQQWVSALEGMGRQVKQQGSYWMAQCPAHDDSNPSMQIKDKGDGTASIECYAGCDFVDILKAVGFYATGGSKTPETAPSAPPRATPSGSQGTTQAAPVAQRQRRHVLCLPRF